MSNYKNIIGTHIKSVTTDPPNPENGQMWYNSTTRVVKGFTSNPVGAWATGGSTSTSRKAFSGFGTQTAAIAAGGNTARPGITRTLNVENYDGTSWTEVNNINTDRYAHRGTGTSTSGIIFGGDTPPKSAATETWDGTNWTEVADLNTARYEGSSSGESSTAALFIGGYEYPGTSLL